MGKESHFGKEMNLILGRSMQKTREECLKMLEANPSGYPDVVNVCIEAVGNASGGDPPVAYVRGREYAVNTCERETFVLHGRIHHVPTKFVRYGVFDEAGKELCMAAQWSFVFARALSATNQLSRGTAGTRWKSYELDWICYTEEHLLKGYGSHAFCVCNPSSPREEWIVADAAGIRPYAAMLAGLHLPDGDVRIVTKELLPMSARSVEDQRYADCVDYMSNSISGERYVQSVIHDFVDIHDL